MAKIELNLTCLRILTVGFKFATGVTMDLISHVVLVGAGTRVPKVQEKLTAYVKTELSKNINTDEAAALGAVYKAADLSQGFKVKKFITKDCVLFPIQIVFDRTVDDKVKQVGSFLHLINYCTLHFYIYWILF